MHDPLEGRTASGKIATGVDLARVPDVYRAVLDAATEAATREGASLYLYGSVATGQARPPRSDVDLLTIGLPSEIASVLSDALSEQFADLTRRVAIAPASASDFVGGGDQAYGGRVFLHHYCAHLAGEDHDRAVEPFPADRRAARGFNGDIGRALDRWQATLGSPDAPSLRAVARKTLFAVAGLVSIHDETWTTDRRQAARRWAEVEPALATDLDDLVRWSEEPKPDGSAVGRMVRDVVPPVVAAFADMIGLWGDTSD